MKQQTLAAADDQGAGFEQYRRPTKRDVFLATMEQIVPWQELCATDAARDQPNITHDPVTLDVCPLVPCFNDSSNSPELLDTHRRSHPWPGDVRPSTHALATSPAPPYAVHPPSTGTKAPVT